MIFISWFFNIDYIIDYIFENKVLMMFNIKKVLETENK